MLKALLFGLTVALLVPAAPSAQAQARSVTASTLRQMLYIAQTVVPDSVTGNLQTGATARVAPIATSAEGFGASVAATSIDADLLPGLMPPLYFAVPATTPLPQDTVLADMQTWLASNVNAFGTRLSAWMRTQGLSSAHFTFSQPVLIQQSDGPSERAIFWSYTVDQNGRALYGKARLVNPDPVYIEALYANRRVPQGLPPNWTYTDAGKLIYRILDKRMTPLTDFVKIEVNGAFDSGAIDAGDESTDAVVRCLTDERNPGCGAAPTSMRRLMNQFGAAGAILDYVHAVEPLYEDATNCTLPDGTVEAECERAVAAISYTQRTWNCDGLRNVGHIGYTLQVHSSRYIVAPDTPVYRATLLEQHMRLAISPTATFDKLLPQNQVTVNPDSVLISPLHNDYSLLARNDANLNAQLVHVAPLQTGGTGGGVRFKVSHVDTYLSEAGGAGAPRTHTYWGEAKGLNPSGGERWLNFQVNKLADLEMLNLTALTVEGPFEVAVNGQVVLSHPGHLLRTNVIYPADMVACKPAHGGWGCGPVDMTKPGTCLHNPASDDNGWPTCAIPWVWFEPTAVWAVYRRGCSVVFDVHNNTAPFWLCDEYSQGQVRSTFLRPWSGTAWITDTSYTNSFYPYLNLKPYLRQGLNQIVIKVMPTNSFEMRLESYACEEVGAGVSLPAVISAPPPANYGVGDVRSGW